MRVAFVSQPWDNVGPAVCGSIGILTYQIARRLARSCDVIVYTKKEKHEKEVAFYEGIQFRRMAMEPDHASMRFLGPLSRLRPAKSPLFASSLYYLGYALQVANDLRQRQCDIIHVHQFSQFIPIIRAFNPRAKVVLHMNCEWLTQLDKKMIERRLGKADLIVGCSEYITDKVRSAFPRFGERYHTVFNGVDAECFANSDAPRGNKVGGVKQLLFVGRVSPEKGLHVLLEAFREVAWQHPQVRLDIVGPEAVPPMEFLVGLDEELKKLEPFYSGSYLSKLQNMLPPHEAGQVTFAGAVPHSQVVGHYLNADIVVFPSLWNEPFGIPVAEAMACRLPVVATRSGGIREIVLEGKTGLLVERGSDSELAAAIIRLLADEGLRESMGQAGRERVLELFSWERIVDDLLRHYNFLCQAEVNQVRQP